MDTFHTLQPAMGAYVAAMGPILSLRSLWTFPHIRRMGSPSGCGYCLPLSLPPTAATAAACGVHDTKGDEYMPSRSQYARARPLALVDGPSSAGPYHHLASSYTSTKNLQHVRRQI